MHGDDWGEGRVGIRDLPFLLLVPYIIFFVDVPKKNWQCPLRTLLEPRAQ